LELVRIAREDVIDDRLGPPDLAGSFRWSRPLVPTVDMGKLMAVYSEALAG